MRIVQPTMEHVGARNPLVRLGPPPPLPPEPTIDDQRAVQIELRTHGSKETGDAFQDWATKVRNFLFEATHFETICEQGGRGEELRDARGHMDTARGEANEAADNLARLVSDELAAF